MLYVLPPLRKVSQYVLHLGVGEGRLWATQVDVIKLDHMSRTATRTRAVLKCVLVHGGADEYAGQNISLSHQDTNLNHIGGSKALSLSFGLLISMVPMETGERW